jgi:DNA mismatch endonuclease, patch repair protein
VVPLGHSQVARKQSSSNVRGWAATDAKRSALMARVRQKGTAPELIVRAIVRRHGHRFGTNGNGLPGSPDLFDRRRRLAVFVHGCFWHRHSGCRATTTPKQNKEYWITKFEANVVRDRRQKQQLRRMGFRVLTVWECQAKSKSKLARLELRLERFFQNTTPSSQRAGTGEHTLVGITR